MKKEYFYTASPAESEAVGAMLAERLLANEALPRYIALYGDLGVGKTAFVRGVTSVLCPGAAVRSPTFALVHEYRGKLPVFHFDMYRILDEDDLYSTGFYDYIEQGSIVITEWTELFEDSVPEGAIRLKIETLSETERRFTLC